MAPALGGDGKICQMFLDSIVKKQWRCMIVVFVDGEREGEREGSTI